jgi:hypothetical protein
LHSLRKPNARKEAVAVFNFYRQRGYRISIRSVGRVLREQRIRFRDAELFRWLSPLRAGVVKRALEGSTPQSYHPPTRRSRLSARCSGCRETKVIVAQGEGGRGKTLELYCADCCKKAYGGGPAEMFGQIPYGPGAPMAAKSS